MLMSKNSSCGAPTFLTYGEFCLTDAVYGIVVIAVIKILISGDPEVGVQ